MPLKSKKQGRFLERKFGHAWVKKHHFGGPRKDLPEQAKKKEK